MGTLGTKPAEASSGSPVPLRPERRRIRQKVHTPAYASFSGNASGPVLDLSEILDISEDGMAIRTSSPLEPNRNVNLCLDLSETKAYIHTTGQVIWVDNSGRAGIRFPSMPETSQRQLKEWLFLNAVMACVHHADTLPGKALASSVEADRTARPGNSGATTADYTSILIALEAVRKEVHALGTNLDAALQLIAERAQAFTRGTGAAIALTYGKEMVCRASAGADAPPIGTRLDSSAGFSGECIRTGKLLRCDDSETDSRVDRESCRGLGIRSIGAAPIRVAGTVVGLLEVFSPNAHAFGENDNTILLRLTETVSGAVSRGTSPSNGSKAENQAPAVSEPEVQQESVPLAEDTSPWGTFRRVVLITAVLSVAVLLWWVAAPWVSSSKAHTPKASTATSAALKPPVDTKPGLASAGGIEGLRKLAQDGNPSAQFALGAHYATGEDVQQDFSEAVRWFSKAAEQGHVIAQGTLGAYYGIGRGVPRDLNKAYFWSILAQTGGDEASRYRIPLLVSQMSHAQVVAAQQQANDWLRQHQAAPPSTPAGH